MFVGQGTRARSGHRTGQPARRRPTSSRRCVGLVPARDGGRRVRPQLRPVLRARHVHADRRSRSSWRRSPGRWAASTSRTCATRRRASSTACARRSRSARRAACRRRSRTTRSSARANWGKSVDTLRSSIDEARARGVDATIDQYPYTASSTSIQAALMPAWSLEGGRAGGAEAAAEPVDALRSSRRRRARIILDERGGGDPQNVQLARCDWDPSLAGKRLGDVTKRRGLPSRPSRTPPRRRCGSSSSGGCAGIFHAIDEDDLQRILRASGDDDRIGRRDSDLRRRNVRTRAATARSCACSAATCAS